MRDKMRLSLPRGGGFKSVRLPPIRIPCGVKLGLQAGKRNQAYQRVKHLYAPTIMLSGWYSFQEQIIAGASDTPVW
jgi:hypothetical protein